MSHTRGFLNYFFAPGAIVELRALNLATKYIVSGKYTDFDKMAQDAAYLDAAPDVRAVHFVVNSIDPTKADPIATSMNVFTTSRVTFPLRTTGDAAVTRRNVYFIDFDPVRPSGVCSTAAEKQAAWDTVNQAIAYLTKQGWPEPLIVDSGNGYHVYYRADGCDPDSPFWRRVLGQLSQKFSDECVKIDTSVHSPGQLSRLPGTMNRKGENTPERPHRRCQVVQAPKGWRPLMHGLIYRLAESFGPMLVTQESIELPPLVDDVEDQIEEFFDDYGLEHWEPYEKKGKTYYALKECPFHGGPHSNQPGKTCIILSDTSVGFHCFSDDCDGYSFGDLRRHLTETTGIKSDVRFYEELDEDEKQEAMFIDLENASVRWGVDLDEILLEPPSDCDANKPIAKDDPILTPAEFQARVNSLYSVVDAEEAIRNNRWTAEMIVNAIRNGFLSVRTVALALEKITE
jgi:hypothetical protein